MRNATPGGRGVDAVVNAARGGAATALQTVADGGHLATITGDPPSPERGVTVANIYVRADGARLAVLVAALAEGLLSLHVGATFALADAATALQGAVTGRAVGATVLTLEGISSDAADHKQVVTAVSTASRAPDLPRDLRKDGGRTEVATVAYPSTVSSTSR